MHSTTYYFCRNRIPAVALNYKVLNTVCGDRVSEWVDVAQKAH